MSDRGYPASAMGPRLIRHVEHDLFNDLRHYGVPPEGLRFDWSDPVQEGHVTRYLDGQLESMSGVVVVGARGEPRARGWIDFIHGKDDAPLLVFWLFLDLWQGGAWLPAKADPGLPQHVWLDLPEHSKHLCASADGYDAQWRNDPLVQVWLSSATKG